MTADSNAAEKQGAQSEYLELPLYISYERERPLDRFYNFIKKGFVSLNQNLFNCWWR